MEPEVNGRGMKKVIIVGAGLAGLLAAYELQKRGVDITVLEAESEAGGRARSVKWRDMWIDLGAQQFNDVDAGLGSVVGELGLDKRKRDLPKKDLVFQILRNDKWYPVSLGNAASLFRSDLLSTSAKLRMAGIGAALLKAQKQIGDEPADAYQIWRVAGLDDESIETWLSRINPQYLEYIAEPVYDLYWGYRPHEVSKAVYLYSASHMKDTALYTFDEGIGLVSRTLAERLNVITGARVSKVTAGETSVIVEWEQDGRSNRDVADGVIIATLGSSVNSIVQGLDRERNRFFMGVRYLPADMEYFKLSRKIEGYDEYHLFPRKEEELLNMIYYGPGTVNQDQDYLLVCMKMEFHLRTRHMADEDVLNMVEQEVARYLPEAIPAITDRFISRWRSGIPVYYPGYIRSLERFHQLPSIPGVSFAGDYLTFPHTGGAYRSALLAVEELMDTM